MPTRTPTRTHAHTKHPRAQLCMQVPTRAAAAGVTAHKSTFTWRTGLERTGLGRQVSRQRRLRLRAAVRRTRPADRGRAARRRRRDWSRRCTAPRWAFNYRRARTALARTHQRAVGLLGRAVLQQPLLQPTRMQWHAHAPLRCVWVRLDLAALRAQAKQRRKCVQAADRLCLWKT